MKTLTTLTAVAALLAGISLAAAQTSPAPKSGAMGSSSSMRAQQQVAGSGKFCLEQTPGGALQCNYASLELCQKDAKGSQKCSANPNSGTTGSKQ